MMGKIFNKEKTIRVDCPVCHGNWERKANPRLGITAWKCTLCKKGKILQVVSKKLSRRQLQGLIV